MENRNYDLVAAIGRVLIATLFLISGFEKLSAPDQTIVYIASADLPAPTLAYGIALFAELVLSVALVLGYKTRLTAAMLAIFSLVAALTFHFQLGDQNQSIHFFKNIVIVGGLLQIVAFGGGLLSLDSRLGREARSRVLSGRRFT